MNEFKYRFINFVLLVLLGLGIYWAFTSIDNGITYDKNMTVNTTEVTEPLEEVVLFDNTKNETLEPTEDPVIPVVENNNNELIKKLQTLVENKTTMDSGASGSKVGTVQEFLVIYFKDKEVSIDNDFGPTTKGLVRDFQKAELDGGDGRIGPNTLSAMVKYLNK